MSDLKRQTGDVDEPGGQCSSDATAGSSSGGSSSSSSEDAGSSAAHDGSSGAAPVGMAVGSSIQAASVSEPSWKPCLRSGAQQIGSQRSGPVSYSRLCDNLKGVAGCGSLFE